MKKKVFRIGLIVILLFTTMILMWSWKNYLMEETDKYNKIIVEQSLKTRSLTYPYKNLETEAFKLNIGSDREVRFFYWKRDILGRIDIVIQNVEKDIEVTEFSAKSGYNSSVVKLSKGNYVVKTRINSVMGGFVLGCDNSVELSMKPQEDTDNDGLPDNYETEAGTDIHLNDTDGDGLSDYEEVVKYKTNPLTKDSDSDGVIDSDWEERREYIYTVQAIVDLRVPYNLKDMNDMFQDARLIKEIDEKASRVEVILYPDTSLIINPTMYNKNNISNEYTLPTFTKNYSSEMRDEIVKKVGNEKTDIQVILKLIKELRKTKSIDIVQDLKMDTDMPLDFSLIRNKEDIQVSPSRKSSAFSMKEVEEKVLFADSMYKNNTRAACGSTSILRGGLLRSAGLQERSIFTIPLFYSLDSDNTVFKINEKYLDRKRINLPSEGEAYLVDHVLSEVFIRNQWIQVDFEIRDSFLNYEHPWSIKTICFNDPSEVDFYNKFLNLDFFKERPYKYLSVIEQEKKYK